MNINEIVNMIINKVNKDWPIIYQVRYAYVELGKYLQKNTDFFFSVDNKLQENNLTFKEIESIYNDDVVVSSQVICKSSSILLKSILDRLGIESKLVKSINNVMEYSDGVNSIDINHWFLAVKDKDGEWFFCTLSSDLPYIQMGMETKHFGVNISYLKELSDGTVNQVYEGEEIHNKVIDKNTLRKIDIDIGYICNSYAYDKNGKSTKDYSLQYGNASLFMLRDVVRSNKLFNELEIEKSGFLDEVFEFIGSNGRKISFYEDEISSLNEEDWNIWIKIICKNVLKKIGEIVGYELYPIPLIESNGWNYESWLFSLSVMIEDEVYSRLDLKDNGSIDDNLVIDVTNFDYSKWSKKVKSNFVFDKNYEYENIVLMLDKLNALVMNVRGKNKNGNLNALFHSLSSHFIDANDMYINNVNEDGKLSNSYIANKFSLMFPRIFSCNELITEFNDMSYSEQVVILKEVISIMFPEITVSNSSMISNYDNRYSPVLNRIQIFPIKHKDTLEYSVVFGILGEQNEYDEELNEFDYYYFYDLKSNEFKICDILEVFNNYIIVSDRMKNKFSVEDLEEIESQRKR